MWFKILFSIFLIAQLLYGNTYIGPVTPRQIMAVVMFTVLIQQRQITIDKYFKLYIVFIVFFIVGDMSAGLLEPSFRRLMGFYFVSFVAYQATKVLIAKFDGQKWLAGTLLIIGILDALVTVGYMYGLPISPVIRSFLYIDVQNELIES